jgi:hypothetical protein
MTSWEKEELVQGASVEAEEVQTMAFQEEPYCLDVLQEHGSQQPAFLGEHVSHRWRWHHNALHRQK